MALIAKYTFEWNSNDSVGGFNGTDTAITYVTGKSWQGASMNGTTSWISIVGNTGINLSGNQTYVFWVNFSALPSSGNQVRLWNGYWPSSPYGMYISLLNTAWTYSLRMDYDTATNSTVNQTLSTWTWYRLAFVHDDTADTDYIYLNGSVILTQWSRATNPSASATATKRIWCEDGTGKFTNWILDEFYIYNNAWTSTDALNDYNSFANNSNFFMFF